MRWKSIVGILLVAALLSGCVKQQATDLPGTAFIANLKTSLSIGEVAIIGTVAALPAFKLDAEDQANAVGVLKDIGTTRDSLASRLAKYDHFDSKNAEEIKQAARDAIDTLRELHDKRVDHIKNAQARQRIDVAFNVVQSLAEMILGAQPVTP